MLPYVSAYSQAACCVFVIRHVSVVIDYVTSCPHSTRCTLRTQMSTAFSYFEQTVLCVYVSGRGELRPERQFAKKVLRRFALANYLHCVILKQHHASKQCCRGRVGLLT